jgi:multidrug efflux system membrane fusion protein
MPHRHPPRLLPTPPRRALPALTLGLSLAAALVLVACGKEPVAAEPVRAVRTMIVGQLSSATTRDYAAEIHARVESKLAFRVGGKITQRPVSLGDRVKGGQALAQVDPADLRFGEDAARAGLAAAHAPPPPRRPGQLRADRGRLQALRRLARAGLHQPRRS